MENLNQLLAVKRQKLEKLIELGVDPYPTRSTRTHKIKVLTDNKDGYVSLAPVNAFDPNELGIYNLSGNVWEWCEDWYSPSYYSISPEKDPKGPSFGTSKVIRGGSYKDNIVYLRTTARGAINPYSTLDNVGFRIAKDAE